MNKGREVRAVEMSDLTDSLLAWIAEDEWHAQERIDNGPEWVEEAERYGANFTRVLAECAAKRAILEIHSTHAPEFCDICSTLNADMDGFAEDHPWPCPTIRAVASVYADRPGFRDEWRA